MTSLVKQALSALAERVVDIAFPVYRFSNTPLFYDVLTDAREAIAYIGDGTSLVFSCSASLLVQWFRFFSLRDLRSLCTAHGMNAAKGSKTEIAQLLYYHVCFRRCMRLVYIFKALPVPRRHVERLFGLVGVIPDDIPSRSSRETITRERESAEDCPSQTHEVSYDDAAEGQPGIVVEGLQAIADNGSTDHLRPLDETMKLSVIQEWQAEVNTESLGMVVCAVCSKRVYKSDSEWVHGNNIDLTLLQNKHLPEETLPRSYNLQAYQMAILNPKGLELTETVGRMLICTVCSKSLCASLMPRFALSNWLYYGYESLPDEVKEDFNSSSLFDKMLIARARCNTVTCRFNIKEQSESDTLNGQILAQARKGVRGNVLVSPLDVVRMNKVLPPASSSIRDTMCAVFVGDAVPTRSSIRKYSPVLVRKSRVKRMIQFLFKYNVHYRFSDDFRYSEENLNLLFDGEEGVPSSVHLGFIPPNDAIDSAVADYTPRNVDSGNASEDYSDLLMENVGYTDGDDSPLSYQAMKTRALERCLQGKPFIVSGKGSRHIPDFHNPSILAWLFPHLDPWGIGGFHHPGRVVKITMEEQLSHLLMIDDSPFERDAQFAFVFYNVCRKALVARSLRFTVAHRLHREVVDNLLRTDPDILSKLSQSYMRDPHYKPVDDEEKRVLKLLSSLRMVAKHVPGSDGYKAMLRNEIRSLIGFRGAPTLFITLNPSDVDNPVVRLLAGHNICLEDVSRGEDMSEWQRKLFAAKNPSACARFFDLFISKFIKIVLRYGRKDAGLYGKCQAYYGTVEAQGKGTLHCHMLIWLEGHLSPQDLKVEMGASETYRNLVFDWLESVVKCEFPGNRGIEAQRRRHPRRILHKETNDPHPGVIPMPSAIITRDKIISFWQEYEEMLSRLLHCYSWHVHQATCWKYLEKGQEKTDENCRMGMTGETRELTALDDSDGILLRRHHPNIAPYTDVVTFLLQCNMDVKFVGSGEAAKAFLYYVTDYITKASLPVHVGMAALSYAVKKVYVKLPNGTANSSQSEVVGAVTSAVNSMMGRQEISHPQVMSYLVGGGDHYTNEQFSVLHWGAIRKFVQCYSDQDQGVDQVTQQTEPNSAVSLSLGSKSITASSQQLDYMYRGEDPRIEPMCLYDFVACTSKSRYVKAPSPQTESKMSFIGDDHPQKLTHHIVLRRKRHIPVMLGPGIPNPSRSLENKEEWARDMLTLFKPWRSISDLRRVEETWTQAFEEFQTSLPDHHKCIIKNMNVLTECGEARDNHRKGRQGAANRDKTTEDEYSIALQGENGEVQLVDVAESYQFDPFQDLEDAGAEAPLAFDDILSAEASRLLDMCLFVGGEDFMNAEQGCLNEPSLASINGDARISDHLAVMTRKRRRLHRNEDGDGAEQHRKKMRVDDPLAIVATLKRGYDSYAAVRQMRDIADQIVAEMSLNEEQLTAFNLVADHMINQESEQLLMHVAGVGGTGKSHVIKSIVALFARLDRRHELLLGAPTGIAAVLIGGQTLHSLILATPNGKTRNMAPLTRIWRNVRYLIVDEVSMLGAKFMSQLSARMRQGKGDDISTGIKPFGGVNVIFMGDLGQLKPPKQHALYSHALVKNPSFAEARNTQGINGLNGAFLWRQVDTVVQLKKNQRHQEDPDYASFLDRLRLAVCSSTGVPPLMVSDLDYLRTRLIENQASNAAVMANFSDAPIIVGSKSLRDLLNSKLVKHHARRQNRDLHLYYSRDYIGKKLIKGTGQKKLWGLPSAVNREALGRLPLFVGMKVMVTENLAFDDGVVNGSEGIVNDIKYEEDDKGRRYAVVVYVEIPGSGIGLDGLGKDIVPIFPATTRIDHRVVSSIQAMSKSFSRKQLPLVPAYAYTDFKSQGRTLKRAIVDLATARGQGVYVMLSRVKSLDGLLILKWFPPNKIFHRLPEELREELDRLLTLAT